MIRKLRIEDSRGMLAWMNDATITCLFDKKFNSFDEKKCKEFINSSIKEYDSNEPKNLHFAIINEESDEYRGTVSLKNIDYELLSAEFAIIVVKADQGKGLAKQVYDNIMEYAFNKLRLRFVYFSCKKENVVANKFYKKMNAKCISYEDLLKKMLGSIPNYTKCVLSSYIWYIVE